MRFLFLGILIVLIGSSLADEQRGRENDKNHDNNRDNREKNEKIRTSDISSDPVTGHWNLTSDERSNDLCLKMDAGIELDITYEMLNNSKKTVKIISDDSTKVDFEKSKCHNSSTDINQTLILQFNHGQLYISFTRDRTITGDQSEGKWQLFEISFRFEYDRDEFPDAKKSGQPEILTSHLIKDISSTRGRSFGCTKTGSINLFNDASAISFNSLRVQPCITGKDFGQAEGCAKEQTSDLIPIIIGAALAALVIIVLIAYLVGRARARTTTYDNI
jgi:hypothetical protein